MTDGNISEGEFSRTLQALRDDMSRGFQSVRDDSNRGFSAINTRLDFLNGRTAKHGEDIAVLRRDADGLRAVTETQDVALEDLSRSYNGLSVLIKTRTREAVREVAPSKKVAVAFFAMGGAIVDAAVRLWIMRGH